VPQRQASQGRAHRGRGLVRGLKPLEESGAPACWHRALHRRAARAALQDTPTHRLRHWYAELEKIERRRDGHLDQPAEGFISIAELKKKLADLEERREVAQRELGKLARHHEHRAELERNAEALLERYTFEAREGLDLYTPEDRHDAYRALSIEVISYPVGTVELSGSALGEVRSDGIRPKPIEQSHYEWLCEVTIALRASQPRPRQD
jgi:hypothetical protein